MDTVELTHILTEDNFTKPNFIGVFAADHVPTNAFKSPMCFIANTDPSWKPGGHWLAIFVDYDGSIEFFDSYGQDPIKYHHRIYAFLNQYENYKFNQKQLQSSLSSTCGQFCLYFLLWRCRGVKFETILKNFDKNLTMNDFLVTTFINTCVTET